MIECRVTWMRTRCRRMHRTGRATRRVAPTSDPAGVGLRDGLIAAIYEVIRTRADTSRQHSTDAGSRPRRNSIHRMSSINSWMLLQPSRRSR